MNQHTPGPWRVDIRSGIAVVYFGEENQEPCIEGIPKERILAEFFGEYHEEGHYWTLSEEKQFNARLIAAAPDLLEALKRIADGQWPQAIAETEGTLAMRDVARAAIAKIWGKP